MSDHQHLEYIELETAKNPNACVIWLHGLGASGHDFEPIVPELKLPETAAWRFIFPHAPEIPVTINGGYVMPAWYDILEMSLDRKVDTQQLMRSVLAVKALVDREISRGIASERIVLAGFSQGGAVAYEMALTYPKPLGGLLALSTYFMTEKSIEPSEANESIPIQVMHGSQDPVVPESLGRSAEESLRAKGYSVDYKRYSMEHQVCMEQIADISQWFQTVLR